jgi:hypothetical protein
MNSRYFRGLLFAAAIAIFVTLPSTEVRSQTAVSSGVFDALTQLAARNQEILQKQEDTIRALDDVLQEAKQAKIFSKRG